MAKLIGTAGHVDHGKSTLIQALTGIDPDRLPEEKRRGMTIDIGFAYIDLPRHGRVSIVDVPGHERFLSNMLVGAHGIDVALLCVAADESVMPQTREHLAILDLLPVDRVVVALTRADLADSDLRSLAAAEVAETLASTRFAGSPIVPVSAFTGEGLDVLREQLDLALDHDVEREAGLWYLPIDRVFVAKGYGTIVTGTLARGEVRLEDRAVVEPGGAETRVRGIQWHEVAQTSGEPGRRIALNLSGLKSDDLRRGMAVGAPGALFASRVIDARVRWVGQAKHGMRVRVSIGADEAIAKMFLSDLDADLVQLRLERDTAVARGQALVVRRYSPPDLIAGGRVVTPLAHPRRRGEQAMIAEDAASDEDGILALLAKAPAGLAVDDICRAMGRTAQDLGPAFERLKSEGRALGFAGLWIAPEQLAEAARRLRAALWQIHEAAPGKAGAPRDRVAVAAGLPWKAKPLDRIVAWLVGEGLVRASGAELAHPDFRVRLNARQRELLDRVRAALGAHTINVPGPRELAASLAVPVQAIDEILRVGVEAGEVIRVDEGLFYTLDQIEALKGAARRLAESGPFTAAQFRDALGATRKYVIPVLEHFDAIRFTARVGDARVVEG
jgi:selenocysteine-specific elongation factor